MKDPNDTIRSQLRIPQELYARIKDAAEGAGRSMNAEIVQRLDLSFRRSVDDELVVKFSAEMRDKVEQLTQERNTAQVGAAVSARLLAKALEVPEHLATSDEQKAALKRAREAALGVVNAYKHATDDEFGNIGEFFDNLEKPAGKN